MPRSSWGSFAFALVLLSCGSDSTTGGGEGGAEAGSQPGVVSECGSVRMTTYASSDRRWCGFDRTSPILPDFVRAGMTVAIAEPYNGSSYGGDPGEACGECWQLDTTSGATLVMVHDLCPIEGNPICAGSYFHFDVASEVAAELGSPLGEAALQRVPCPVTGNIHAYVASRNQWGYLQLAFFNHRLPIRSVDYQADGSNDWQPLERCLARWCLDGDTDTFATGAPGGRFRFTSATGETVEGSEVMGDDVASESDFDTGAQFLPVPAPAGRCEFTPPVAVYDDTWGGIVGVRWEPNTWGGTTLSEVTEGCAGGSASCLLLEHFASSGLHITYRHVFPRATFSTLSMALRARSGGGQVLVAPRTSEARCSNPTTVEVSEEWSTVTLELATSCPDAEELHGLTLSLPSGDLDLFVDDIRFE